jgi:hypothetical protein
MNVWPKAYLHANTTFGLDKGEGRQRVLEQMLLTVDGEILYTDAYECPTCGLASEEKEKRIERWKTSRVRSTS